MQNSELNSLTRRSQCFWASVFLLFLCVAVPVDGFAQDSKDPANPQRSIGEYRNDLKSFMKHSKNDDPQQERIAIYNLCQLHGEIVGDSRFDTSQQIQGIRSVIANRLQKYSKDEKNTLLREERASKKAHSAEDGSRLKNDEPNANRWVDEQSERTKDYSEASSKDDTESSMYRAASDSFSSIGAAAGGPNQLFHYVGSMGPPWDHGQDLVDLIVNTIDPTSWRQNGGSASIHYYEPSLALVIYAPLQGQEAAADLLNRLRQNGDTQLNIGGGFGAIGN